MDIPVPGLPQNHRLPLLSTSVSCALTFNHQSLRHGPGNLRVALELNSMLFVARPCAIPCVWSLCVLWPSEGEHPSGRENLLSLRKDDLEARFPGLLHSLLGALENDPVTEATTAQYLQNATT